MSKVDPQRLSDTVQQQASELLASTQLQNTLREFGQVRIEGSYSYKLMLARDIDFEVNCAPESLGIAKRADIAASLSKLPFVSRLKIVDYRNFTPKKPAIHGIWCGLTVPHHDNDWNIDIWFIDKPNAKDSQSVSISEQEILAAKPEQRKIILEIKYLLLYDKQQQKGFSSADVYHAVIKEGIASYRSYLSSRDIV